MKRTTYCEVLNEQVVQRATVTSLETLRPLLGPERAPAKIAIEARREAWYVHDLLTSWDNRVLLVETTRSKQLGVVDDARRFQGAYELESYLGLVPGEDSSGGRRRIGAITKEGNGYLRAVLVQAAWAVLRSSDPDVPLRH